MKLKNILALVLVLCMAFTLCACGETEDNDKKSKGNDEETEEVGGEGEDTKPEVGEYIVYVEDEDGEPVAGVELKFNKDTGNTTITTDEDGKASLTTFVTDIVVTVEEVPEDYEQTDEEYEFDDEFELTITLENA